METKQEVAVANMAEALWHAGWSKAQIEEVQALAQLGARVLEILETTPQITPEDRDRRFPNRYAVGEKAIAAARSLGLLDEKGGRS